VAHNGRGRISNTNPIATTHEVVKAWNRMFPGVTLPDTGRVTLRKAVMIMQRTNHHRYCHEIDRCRGLSFDNSDFQPEET
jgi:hypothetical protein